MTPSEALKTLSNAHCSNTTTSIMSTILIFEEGATAGQGEGRSGPLMGEGVVQKG